MTVAAAAADFSELDSLHVRDLIKMEEIDQHRKKKKDSGSSRKSTKKESKAIPEKEAHSHRSGMSTTSTTTNNTNRSRSSVRRSLPPPPPPPLDDPKRYNNHSKRMDDSSKTHASSVRRSRKSRSPAPPLGKAPKNTTMRDGSLGMQDVSDLTTATTGTLSCSTTNAGEMPDKSDVTLGGSSRTRNTGGASSARRILRPSQSSSPSPRCKLSPLASPSSGSMKDMSGRMTSQLHGDRASRNSRRKQSRSHHDGTVSHALRRRGSGTAIPGFRRTKSDARVPPGGEEGGTHYRRTKSEEGLFPTTRRQLRSPTRRPPTKSTDESSQPYDHARRRRHDSDDLDSLDDLYKVAQQVMPDVSTTSTKSRTTPKGRVLPPPPPPPAHSPGTQPSKPKAVVVTPSPPKTLHLTNDLL